MLRTVSTDGGIRWLFCLSTAVLFTWVSIQSSQGAAIAGEDLDPWLENQASRSVQGMLRNIEPPGVERGAVIASPSRQNPDYYYVWVRDAALTMNVVVRLYEKLQADQTSIQPSGQTSSKALERTILNYVEFSRKNQLTPNRSRGLGEPKFQVDGRAYDADWGRPQNDGAALRALTLTRFAQDLLQQNRRTDWVRTRLYDGRLPTDSVIKADLEYVSHHWEEPSYDLWEETHGQHFYTLMVQRRALLEGAILAGRLNDSEAAGWYRRQAKQIEKELEKHWDPIRGYLVATLNQDAGFMNKVSGLDVAVILASLHALPISSGSSGDDKYFAPSNDKVLATAYRLKEAFRTLYPINQRSHKRWGQSDAQPGIGRYPEDIYDGYSVGLNSGNPWVLATNGYAELYYWVAADWKKTGQIRVTSINLPFLRGLAPEFAKSDRVTPGQTLTSGSPEFQLILQKLNETGDGFLKRLRLHTPADGSFAEQINRDTGFMQGAPDLTWSYASFLTAMLGRGSLSLETFAGNQANELRPNRWLRSQRPAAFR